MTKISFVTFGCTLNISDSETMAGLLKEAGYDIVENKKDAELIVINSCTVKNLAEKKFFKAIEEAKNNNQKIIAAGCVPQAEQSLLINKLKDISVLGTKNLDRIVEIVQETLNNNVIHITKNGTDRRLGIPKIRRNNIIGIVPISEGCLGNCTYCKTKQARGNLRSYELEDIIKEVHSALADGCKEIWLTSQDCGTYGNDIKTNIIVLLNTILNIKGDFHVRLGMSNPNCLIPIVDDLIELYKTHKNKLFRFIHIPVQSGNNRILQLMNRFYSREHYIKLCELLRSALPDITIATDVICGFPTETDKEFEDTLNLLRTIKPDVINRSRFWARPNTKAAEMKQLAGRITNERSRKLNTLTQELSKERNQFWKNWKGSVTVDEKGYLNNDKITWIAHNYAYKPFVIKAMLILGQEITISVKNTDIFHLCAEINE